MNHSFQLKTSIQGSSIVSSGNNRSNQLISNKTSTIKTVLTNSHAYTIRYDLFLLPTRDTTREILPTTGTCEIHYGMYSDIFSSPSPNCFIRKPQVHVCKIEEKMFIQKFLIQEPHRVRTVNQVVILNTESDVLSSS